MITDTEIKQRGIKALIADLGNVQAERFISLIIREPFDYTKWQRDLWPDESVETLSKKSHGSNTNEERRTRCLRGTGQNRAVFERQHLTDSFYL